MGVFNTTRQFNLPQEKIAAVANDVMDALHGQGYDVAGKALLTGGWDISVAKGGTFKAVLGLKTALKISLAPRGTGQMIAEASVGIFGQQAIPTVLMLFVAWPVLITQIWGVVQQSKLDDTVMRLIAEAIQRQCPEAAAAAAVVAVGVGNGGSFCAQCGTALMAGAKFCSGCGAKVG